MISIPVLGHNIIPNRCSLRSMASGSEGWGVAYGKGLYVATAFDGRVFTSYGTHTWTEQTTPIANEWCRIVYAEDLELFVTVADAGPDLAHAVMTSPDGFNWTAQATPYAGVNHYWENIAYGNGIFLSPSGSGDGNALISSDGVSWSLTSMPEGTVHGFAFGNGVFVTCRGDSGFQRILTTTDGVTWTARDTPDGVNNIQWARPAYGNGRWVVIAGFTDESPIAHAAMVSMDDAATWTIASLSAVTWEDLRFGDGLFLAVSQDTAAPMAYSEDGERWTFLSTPTPLASQALGYGNGFFVATGIANGQNIAAVIRRTIDA